MNFAFSSISPIAHLLRSDAVSLNPQPLPPEPPADLFARLGGQHGWVSGLLDKVALNPQPLPPSPPPDLFSGVAALVGRFSGRF